jgi:AcrR family transcriptional regulator
MTDDTDLPDNVALLWGRRATARRGPKPALTVDEITRAAIELADAEGLGAVSMARVASQLGNATMALYRHVRSKDELIMLMADAALTDPPDLPADEDWRADLMHWARAVLAAIRQHPWYARVPLSGPPIGPRNLAWFDRALGALANTGLDEGEKVVIVLGLLTIVHGEVRISTDLSTGFAEDPAAFGQYGKTLATLVDPGRFPALHKVIAAGVFTAEGGSEPDDTSFEFALTRYLDGVAAYLDRRVAARS